VTVESAYDSEHFFLNQFTALTIETRSLSLLYQRDLEIFNCEGMQFISAFAFQNKILCT
jgi:hypothetical protein